MKIYEIKLAFNLLRLGEEVQLSEPEQVLEYMDGAFDEDPTVEWFCVIALDRKNHPLGRTVISKGHNSACLVHPREIFRALCLANAAAFIAVHNHPSGDPAPSSADIQITRQLREAARIIQIDFLDHIIIGDKEGDPFNRGWYSFNESGIL